MEPSLRLASELFLDGLQYFIVLLDVSLDCLLHVRISVVVSIVEKVREDHVKEVVADKPSEV